MEARRNLPSNSFNINAQGGWYHFQIGRKFTCFHRSHQAQLTYHGPTEKRQATKKNARSAKKKRKKTCPSALQQTFLGSRSEKTSQDRPSLDLSVDREGGTIKLKKETRLQKKKKKVGR